MAERKKNRKRKDEISNPEATEAPEKPSKEEYAVAKWIRNNVPSKKTKFLNHNVEYFTGTRAVEALLEKSPWSKTIFESREQIIDFLDTMLRHKFFHRAKKVVLSEQELSKIRGAKKKGKDLPKEEKKSLEKDDSKESKENKEISKETTAEVKEGDEKQDEKKEPKKKPKVRLEMHLEQFFADCNDAYVWIYEPIPAYYWLFGTLVVLGAIGVCLFPLWPLSIRQGVWYLSVAAAGFLVFILALAIIRVIVFALLWLLTLGRHHLWLLPNLAEDVGFFASFWPLYQYEYCGPSADDNKKSNKKKKRKKDKDSDGEDSPLLESEARSATSEQQKSNSGMAEREEGETVEEGRGDERTESGSAGTEAQEAEEGSEEGSESEKSNTGRDFEMVQHTELEDK